MLEQLKSEAFLALFPDAPPDERESLISGAKVVGGALSSVIGAVTTIDGLIKADRGQFSLSFHNVQNAAEVGIGYAAMVLGVNLVAKGIGCWQNPETTQRDSVDEKPIFPTPPSGS